MMDVASVRQLLKDPSQIANQAFEALKTVTALVNKPATHDEGRELVIRLLAVRDLVPQTYHELLEALVRTVGLFPYTQASEALSIEDHILTQAHVAPGLGNDILFHTLQLKIYKLIMAGRNVVLSATTSVGKSLIVDAVVASGRFRKIVVIVPTIALIDETRRRLARQFTATHSIITHPTQQSEEARPIIYVLTQERALSRSDLHDVDFFVIDEFYKLDLKDGVDERGVDLNLCFHRLASNGAQFYLIGPHVDEVRGLAVQYDHTFIPSHFSTVAVDVENFGLPKDGIARKIKVVELCRALTTPTLIFCQSPSKAGEVAQALIDANVCPETQVTADAVDWLEQEFPAEWIVTRALRHGIGIHHGNVPRALQQYMVKAFETRAVQFLICTSTLIEGVNTVAENVIVYDRRIKMSNVDYFTFRNIAGRAGRMGRYFIGKVFVLEEPPELDNFTVDLPIEQQNEETPISLLLDLPRDYWADVSERRVSALVAESTLSFETLQANRHIPMAAQRAVANAIRTDFLYQRNLNWRGLPTGPQLQAVCELIYKYIDEGKTLKGYQIFNGQQLSAVLSKLRTVRSFREFIEDRVANKRPEQSISDAVESSLRFLRKYICYTLPRLISGIDAIQREVLTALNFESGDYSYYAARVENLFLDAGLFALDEYGIPPELARKLGVQWKEVETLDGALSLVQAMDVGSMNVHPFERTLLIDLQSSLISHRPS